MSPPSLSKVLTTLKAIQDEFNQASRTARKFRSPI